MTIRSQVNSKRAVDIHQTRFSEMAKQEFALTATAFFAPVVGTVNVMRCLFQGMGQVPPTPTTRVEADARPRGKRAA
jgi:hypothetical protein